jgi:hypothetical protein
MEIMAKTNEVYAYFQLSGVELDPDQITTQVGIKPTKTWKTGDVVVYPNGRTTTRTRKFSVWEVRSQLNPAAELDPTQALDLHLESVFRQLETGWESLVQVCLHYEALVCGVIYAYTDIPAIHFNKEQIKKISDLNAGIDIDVYSFMEKLAD